MAKAYDRDLRVRVAAAMEAGASNKAAAAGHEPCVPALPGEVYFNSAPVLPDVLRTKVAVFAGRVLSRRRMTRIVRRIQERRRAASRPLTET